jgi:hypothetical protein
MPNVIVEIRAEIARVGALLPRLDPQTRLRAQRTMAGAEYALAYNNYEAIHEAIDDLKEFDAPAAAPAPEAEK